MGRGSDEHHVGLGHTLNPGRDVDRVAGEHPVTRRRRALEVDEHLAGLDADAHRDLRLGLRGKGAVQLGEHRLHLERAADRSLGIVLVDGGDAENREEGVTHELLEQAAVALDLFAEAIERPAHERLNDFRILPLGERGRADDVTEQSGGELALLAGRNRLLGQSRPALGAELARVGILDAARGTDPGHP